MNTLYSWEMETIDGVIRTQYNENGEEQTWKDLPLDDICRVSLIPTIPLLPRHDVFIDKANGECFVKRFGRGFMKMDGAGIGLKHYVNCIVTNLYRFWIFPDGRTMVTHKDYELCL